MTNHSSFNLALLNNLRLTKKSVYSKKVNKHIFLLKNFLIKKQKHEKVGHLYAKKFEGHFKNYKQSLKRYRGIPVVYTVFFSISPVNTFLHVTDVLGNLKFRYSAGLADFKGKSKRNRLQVLDFFFRELQKLRISTLKKKPISLHLSNVGFYKHFIVKNLKKNFFIRLVKNYQTYPYNGCRKKKKLRK